MTNESYHEPVLVQEVLRHLAPLKEARIIDATLGSAGHTLELVKSEADVLGIDADREMLEVADERLKKACPTPNQNGLGSFKLTYGNFRNIEALASQEDFSEVDGILFDLGVSNIQLTSQKRGFSFTNPDADLDMRVDPTNQGPKANDLLNGLRQDHLQTLFAKVLKYSEARSLAKEIVERRERKPFATVGDFLGATKKVRGKKDLHPGTLPFLALRMAVNSELENLAETLPKAFSLLAKGGKILVITFHSGEEKVVLDFYFEKEREGSARVLTKRGVAPSLREVRENPRARSAELWVLEKI